MQATLRPASAYLGAIAGHSAKLAQRSKMKNLVAIRKEF
jgi:hypothetical protein